MPDRYADIYTRPADIDVDTLANLGPLRALAGVWKGVGGVDLNPGPAEEPSWKRISAPTASA